MKQSKTIRFIISGMLLVGVALLLSLVSWSVTYAQSPFGQGTGSQGRDGASTGTGRTPTTDEGIITDTTTTEPTSDSGATSESSATDSSGTASGTEEAPATSGSGASTSATEDVCNGIKATGGTCDDAPGAKTVKDIIALAINILSFIVGVAAVIMIIINGFKFVTSSGETAAVASAKNGIIFAIIGLVVVALAQVLVRFVINKATGL